MFEKKIKMPVGVKIKPKNLNILSCFMKNLEFSENCQKISILVKIMGES